MIIGIDRLSEFEKLRFWDEILELVGVNRYKRLLDLRTQ